MFGAIVSGRLVQTGWWISFDLIARIFSFMIFCLDFQLIEESKFLINIPDADQINYLVIFLTGVIPLPIGAAGGESNLKFSRISLI
jgi:Protein of unknown function (DUF775)